MDVAHSDFRKLMSCVTNFDLPRGVVALAILFCFITHIRQLIAFIREFLYDGTSGLLCRE